MKKCLSFLILFFIIFLLAACSKNVSLELADMNVKIVKDKKLLGSTVITEGERKGEELIPTALYYEFTIKNTGNNILGTAEANKGIELKIEPKDQLKSASKDIMGFNIYIPEEYDASGLGFGETHTSIPSSDQEVKGTLYYKLGVSEDVPDVALHVPPKEKVDELKGYALDAYLIITKENKEIARFDLDKFKK